MWTAILPILSKFWKPIAALLLLLAIAWYVDTKIEAWGQEHFRRGYEQRDAEYKRELEKLKADYQTALEEGQRTSYEESKRYQEELAAIRNRKPAPSVWLCNAAPDRVPATAAGATAGGPDGGTASGLPEARRDIGAPLYEIADDADAVAAQLTRLQSWVKRECMR